MPKNKKTHCRQEHRRAAQGACGRALLQRCLYEHQQQLLLQRGQYRRIEEQRQQQADSLQQQQQQQVETSEQQQQQAKSRDQQQQQVESPEEQAKCSDQQQQQLESPSCYETPIDKYNNKTNACMDAILLKSASPILTGSISVSSKPLHPQGQRALRNRGGGHGGLLFARQHRLLEYFRGKTKAQQRHNKTAAAAEQLQSVTTQSSLEEFVSTVLPLQQTWCLPATSNTKERYNSSDSHPFLCHRGDQVSSFLSCAAIFPGRSHFSSGDAYDNGAATMKETSLSPFLRISPIPSREALAHTAASWALSNDASSIAVTQTVDTSRSAAKEKRTEGSSAARDTYVAHANTGTPPSAAGIASATLCSLSKTVPAVVVSIASGASAQVEEAAPAPAPAPAASTAAISRDSLVAPWRTTLDDCGVEVRLPRRPVPICLSWFPHITDEATAGSDSISGTILQQKVEKRMQEPEYNYRKGAATSITADAAARAAVAVNTKAAEEKRERLKARRHNRRCVRLLLSGSLAEAATLHNAAFIREQQQRQRIRWGKEQKKAGKERRHRKAAAIRWKGSRSAAAPDASAKRRQQVSNAYKSCRRSSPSTEAPVVVDRLQITAPGKSYTSLCEIDVSDRHLRNGKRSCSKSRRSRSRSSSSSHRSGSICTRSWHSDNVCSLSGASEKSVSSSRNTRHRGTRTFNTQSSSNIISRCSSSSSPRSSTVSHDRSNSEINSSISRSSTSKRNSSSSSSSNSSSKSTSRSSRSGRRRSRACNNKRSTSSNSSSRCSNKSSSSKSSSSRSSSSRSNNGERLIISSKKWDEGIGFEESEDRSHDFQCSNGESVERWDAMLEPQQQKKCGGSFPVATVRKGHETAAEWDSREREAFLKWRAELGIIEETGQDKFILTPYERNIDVWRQLWRVLEKSHLLLQIVDGRDPAFYRSRDLEQLVKELDIRKEVILVINKADFMPGAVRAAWSKTLKEEGTPHIFFSSLSEVCAQQQRQQLQAHGQEDASQESQQTKQEEGNSFDEFSKGRSNSSSRTSPRGPIENISEQTACSDAYGSTTSNGAEGWHTCGRRSNSDSNASSREISLCNTSNSRGAVRLEASNIRSSSRSIITSCRSTNSSGKVNVDSGCARSVSPASAQIWKSEDLLAFLTSRRHAYLDDFYNMLARHHEQQEQRQSNSALQRSEGTKGRRQLGGSLGLKGSASAAANAHLLITASAGETAGKRAFDATAGTPAPLSPAKQTDTPAADAASSSFYFPRAPAPPLHLSSPSLSRLVANDSAKGAAAATAGGAACAAITSAATVAAADFLKRREMFRERIAASAFVVGLVGFPNVGKSSMINALFGCKRVSVSKQPGKTKHLQTLPLENTGIVLCDSPGLVFPRCVASKHHLVANGVLPLDTMGSNYLAAVQVVCDRVPSDVLLSRYGIIAYAGGTAGQRQWLQQSAYPHGSPQQITLRMGTPSVDSYQLGAAVVSASLSEQTGRVPGAASDLPEKLSLSAVAARSSIQATAVPAAVTTTGAGRVRSRQQQDVLGSAERGGLLQRMEAATLLNAVAMRRKFTTGGRGGQLDLYRAAALVLTHYINGHLVACRGPDGSIHAGIASKCARVLAKGTDHQQSVSPPAHRQQRRHQGSTMKDREQQKRQEPNADESLERGQQLEQGLQTGVAARVACDPMFEVHRAGGHESAAYTEEPADQEGGIQVRNAATKSICVYRGTTAGQTPKRCEDEEGSAIEADWRAAGAWQQGAARRRAFESTTAGEAEGTNAAARPRCQQDLEVVAAAIGRAHGREAEHLEVEQVCSGGGGWVRRKVCPQVVREEGRSTAGDEGNYLQHSEVIEGVAADCTVKLESASANENTLYSIGFAAMDERSALHAEKALLQEILACTKDGALLQVFSERANQSGILPPQQDHYQKTSKQVTLSWIS